MSVSHGEPMDADKQFIIAMFNSHVKDRQICLDGQNKKHCGKEGHFLEKQMGLKPNAKNGPDMRGYEMKTGESVTTFVDKAPNIMFMNGAPLPKRNATEKRKFWEKYASEKESDKPTIGGWRIYKFNCSGQKLCVDEENNIFVLYDYSHDKRPNKESLQLDKEPHKIMQWNADALKSSIENKFNQKGFFKCIKRDNAFVKICFGGPITFDFWIDQVKKGFIYHDGYSKVNGRGRHVFRAPNKFWNDLITEEYS
jgi:hypothetical protein